MNHKGNPCESEMTVGGPTVFDFEFDHKTKSHSINEGQTLIRKLFAKMRSTLEFFVSN
ncbi:MAG: hypothetical protein HQM16_18150 [Deltaproteobacteria bacterium]|nr:hypothetical protein [Deltaproteobacteria bacterium]